MVGGRLENRGQINQNFIYFLLFFLAVKAMTLLITIFSCMLNHIGGYLAQSKYTPGKLNNYSVTFHQPQASCTCQALMQAIQLKHLSSKKKKKETKNK